MCSPIIMYPSRFTGPWNALMLAINSVTMPMSTKITTVQCTQWATCVSCLIYDLNSSFLQFCANKALLIELAKGHV